jgi:predicted nucleotidyltransferase
VAICGQTLPPVAGAILHGSLATGAFVPGLSDVDVLVIVTEEPAAAELAALASAVEGLRRGAPARADLCVVTSGTAATPNPTPRVEIFVGLDPGNVRDLEVETRRTRRDLVVELSVCRARGRSLAGPPPVELIGEVPDEWVMDVGNEVLSTWLGQAYDREMGSFMVFTTCRIWRFAEERVHCSKQEAARWALTRDSSLEVVDSALAGEAIEEKAVRAFLTFVQDATLADPPRSAGLDGA